MKIKKNRKSPLAALILLVAATVLFTAVSDSISTSAVNALRMCGNAVVPSLFPFMVLSTLAGVAAAKIRDGRWQYIIPTVLGLLCGLPSGAQAIASIRKNGTFPKEEAEHILLLFATAGPAFIVGVIGTGFWNSTELGWIFYICHISASTLIYLGWRMIRRRKRHRVSTVADNSSNDTCHPSPELASEIGFDRLCRIFCNAVGDSAVAVIRICGFIVFFRVICDLMLIVTDDPRLYAVISSVLEFTSGSSSAATLGGDMGVFICGTALGFSGLSVMAQCGSIMGGIAPMGFLFKAKLLSAPLSGGLALLVYRLLDCTADTFAVTAPDVSTVPSVISVSVLLLALPAKLISFRHSRTTDTVKQSRLPSQK